MDPYEGFAARYDLSFGLAPEQDMQTINFFRQVFMQHQIQTVLDCACGTGRYLPLFHSLDCKVFGSDISESMLAQAKAKLEESGLEIPLYQVDFRDLPSHFHHPFDAVVCLAAIGFMTGEQEILKALESIWQVLHPGGVLILSAMPTDCQWREQPRFVLNANSPDFSRIFAIDYLGNKARFNILDVFHSLERSDLKVWSAELHVFLRDDQERMLRTVGFRAMEFYGAFDFSPYNKEMSKSLITVAYK